MEKWQILIYGAGAYLALRSLVSLMAEHRQRYAQKLAASRPAAADDRGTKPDAAKTHAA